MQFSATQVESFWVSIPVSETTQSIAVGSLEREVAAARSMRALPGTHVGGAGVSRGER